MAVPITGNNQVGNTIIKMSYVGIFKLLFAETIAISASSAFIASSGLTAFGFDRNRYTGARRSIIRPYNWMCTNRGAFAGLSRRQASKPLQRSEQTGRRARGYAGTLLMILERSLTDTGEHQIVILPVSRRGLQH